MHSERYILSFIFLFCLSLTGSPQQPGTPLPMDQKGVEYINQLISGLNLEEKISLLSGMGTNRSEFGDRGVTVFGIKGIPAKGIPDYIMGHGITGVRSGRDRHTHSTYFGTPIAYASTWNEDLWAQISCGIATEMRALGQDLNLGPTLNIIRHPLGGRNWECLSEDPYLTARFAVRFTREMQARGICCGPKHFVANNQDRHRFDINNVVDERTLREIYLPGFKAAVKEGGALNIMGAYNRVNGVFMCQHKRFLTEILREEWGFNGFVLSDFSKGLRSTLAGVCAGCDLEMNGPGIYGKSLLKEVREGAVSTATIDSMLFHILGTMYKFDVFNRPRREHEEMLHSKAHQELALQVARESPVLLKNEGHLLPLAKEKIRSLAVIGPNATRFPSLPLSMFKYAYYLQGGGSGRTFYYPDALIDPLTGILNQAGEETEIKYAPGCLSPDLYAGEGQEDRIMGEDSLLQEAVALAIDADAVMVIVGLSGFNETEGKDRESAGLPGYQNRLIEELARVNPDIAVVVCAGCYLDMQPWVDRVKSILFVPYGGEKTGAGIAELLFGLAAPSGKLTFTWPHMIKDYPEGSHFNGPPYSVSGLSNHYSEGIMVGYRWFDSREIEPMYPFGFGLGYVSFKYSNLCVHQKEDFDVGLSFLVENKGIMPSAEICQLYIHDPESTLERPVQELKGFRKIFLEPGEKQRVHFDLDAAAFSFYNPETREWIVEKGVFEIRVGSSSRDIRIRKTIEL